MQIGGPEGWFRFHRRHYGEQRWGKLFIALCDTSKQEEGKVCVCSDPPSTCFPLYKPHVFLSRESARPQFSNFKPYYLDFASILPVAALSVKPGMNVLDMCAAPGGKSLVIASKLFGGTDKSSIRSKLVLNEPDASRMGRLKETLRRHMIDYTDPALMFVSCDATKSVFHLSMQGPFDAILVDAPCSSDRHLLGNVNEWRKWSPSFVKRQCERQKALMRGAVSLLNTCRGGRIVYSTCALSFEENDGVIEYAIEYAKKKNLEISIFDFTQDNSDLSKQFDIDNVSFAIHSLDGSLLSRSEVESSGVHEDPFSMAPNRNRRKDDRLLHVGLTRTQYGLCALPDLSSGCGPIYFARLEFCTKSAIC